MKFLSVFLVACFLFLSFAGAVKPVMAPTGKIKSQCSLAKCMQGKSSCPKNPNKGQNRGCDKQGCTMMLSCSVCGFFGVGTMRLKTRPANMIPKPVPLYKIGDLSAYHPSDWKPPKIS